MLLYSKTPHKLNMLFCNVNSQKENIICNIFYLFSHQNLFGAEEKNPLTYFGHSF